MTIGYIKDLGKMRDILEEEVEKLLRDKFAKESEGTYDLNIQCNGGEMSYAVEVDKDEVYLILVDSQTGDLLYDIELGCMDIEELAAVADDLGKRQEEARRW